MEYIITGTTLGGIRTNAGMPVSYLWSGKGRRRKRPGGGMDGSGAAGAEVDEGSGGRKTEGRGGASWLRQ